MEPVIFLQATIDGIGHLGAEVMLLSGWVIVLIAGLVPTIANTGALRTLTMLTLAATAWWVVRDWPADTLTLFGGLLKHDAFGALAKLIFCTSALFAVAITSRGQRQSHEYFLLLLAAVLGGQLAAMSTHLLVMVLALEIVSLCGYALAGFAFTKTGAEGSLKYFILGSALTALMIYGASLLYGATGSMDFSSDVFAAGLLRAPTPLVWVGGLLLVAGLLMKIASVPFHFWAPDAYEAGPTPVVAFLAVVPKVAAMVVLARVMWVLHAGGEALVPWPTILGVAALASMVVGNLAALGQTTPKRLLAYSSIAQSGFMLAALSCLTPEGLSAWVFYAVVFAAANWVVFIALDVFEKEHGCTEVSSFAGLGRHRVALAVVLSLGLLSLTGLPPAGGFTAKLFLFTTLWGTFEGNGEWLYQLLFFVGLANTVVSLFFYLKIPYYLFFKTAPGMSATRGTRWPILLLTILSVLLVAVFLRPDALTGWINRVTFAW